MFDDDNREEFDLADPTSTSTSSKPASRPLYSSALRSRPLSLNPLHDLALDQATLDTREGATSPDDSPEAQPSPAALDRRRYLPSPRRHTTIPGLFPRNSVNLLIGSSTAGKTALLLSQFDLYASAGEFLGHHTLPGYSPAQLGCLIATGTIESLQDRIHALHLDALADPTIFPKEKWRPLADETTAAALRRYHDALCLAAGHPVHLLIVEGLQLMLEGSGKVNDPKAVKDFFEVLFDFCLDRNVTILGTVNQSKQLRGQSYSLLSDKIYGSIVWAQEAQTLIGVEWTRLDLPEERRPTTRRVVIQPRGLQGPLDEQESLRRSNLPSEPAAGATSLPAQNLGTQDDPAPAPAPASSAQPATPARPQRSVIYCDFDERGRLVVVPTGILGDVESATFHRLDAMLDREQPGRTLTKDDLLAWGDSLGVKLRTVERWLASRCDPSLMLLERMGSNRDRTYRKPLEN